jgi:hypothetical protein
MREKEKKTVDKKKEWSAPTLTILDVESATNGVPGPIGPDGSYS